MMNPASIGIVLVAFVALVAFWQGDRALQRSVGASKQTAKIERATDNAISKGKRAATASASDGVRGQRDPTTRDD
jgi:hypothetical protein